MAKNNKCDSIKDPEKRKACLSRLNSSVEGKRRHTPKEEKRKKRRGGWGLQ